MSHGHGEATVRTSCGARSNRVNCTGIVRFFGVQKYNKIVQRPYDNRAVCDRRRSATGARTMLPTMDLQATMPTTNRKNITPR